MEETKIFSRNMKILFGKDYTSMEFSDLFNTYLALKVYCNENKLPLDMTSWSPDDCLLCKLSLA